jgi:hypothetical protein
MGAGDSVHPPSRASLGNGAEFGVGVRGKMIDRHHKAQPELLHILDMALKVGQTAFHRLHVLGAEVAFGDAAMHFERPHSGDDHRGIGLEPSLPAFDIEELLRAEIGAETRFRHDHIGELKRRLGRDHGIAAMRDIGEWAALDERGRAFQRLHKVRLQGVQPIPLPVSSAFFGFSAKKP